MNNILEVNSVMLSYHGRSIITDCYLKCETGEIVGLLGRNGSGKSSLLKIIFGTLRVQNKIIRINKKNYLSPYRKRILIAYLPQESFLPQNMRVENIIDIYIDSEAQKFILEDERVRTYLNKTVAQLSGGQLRYFELLLIINLNTMFVLLDEPFSKIEPLYKEFIADLIKKYRTTIGFILTDHDYKNVISLSDSIFLLTDGVCKKLVDLSDLEKYNYVPASAVAHPFLANRLSSE